MPPFASCQDTRGYVVSATLKLYLIAWYGQSCSRGGFEVVAIVRIRERETESKRVEDWYDSRTSQTWRVSLE